MHINRSTISKIENGKFNLSIDYLSKFSWINLKDVKLIERLSSLKIKKHKFHFKLFDDDRNIYYEWLSKTNYSFDPLEEMGYGVGCTEIHYWENRK